MKEFFKNQLESLYVRTGFRQLENMMQSPNWQKDISDLIGFMVSECNKPPFHSVTDEVKKRVISRAVVEDQEFTGLNAKFVRRALNAWWKDNGDKILEAINAKEASVYKRVELTPEQNDKVNTMIESYRRRLLSGDGIKMLPRGMDPDKAEKDGAEWRSEVERKGIVHSNGITPEQYELKKKLQKAASVFYAGRISFDLKAFRVGDVEFMAENQADAEQIYEIATKQE